MPIATIHIGAGGSDVKKHALLMSVSQVSAASLEVLTDTGQGDYSRKSKSNLWASSVQTVVEHRAGGPKSA